MLLPRIGVGVLLLRGNQVLVGKRKGAHGAGTWAAPGGHLEFGESIETCARREVQEETGLRLETLQHGPFTNDIFPSENKHYVTLFVLAKPATFDPRLLEPDKCEGWIWCDWESLPEPLFPPLANLKAQGYIARWDQVRPTISAPP